ncbi:unnamed protein product, partial [Didymodactylos carnosus]
MASARSPSIRQQQKLALVVGNNRYVTESVSLYTCVKDATDVAAILKNIGFQVTFDTDLDCTSFKRLIKDFIRKVQDGDFVLFFFAGHGMQSDDQNYMLPCDYDYVNRRDQNYGEQDYLRVYAVNAQNSLKQITEQKPFVTIFMLDCCRRNTRAGGILENHAGLCPMMAPAESLIVFSCAPGRSADDSPVNGRNGVFTKHLLKHITKPDVDVEFILRLVGQGVHDETKGYQLPYRTSCITHPHIHLVSTSVPQQRVIKNITSHCMVGTGINGRNDEDIEILADILKVNITFTQLHLRWNKLSDRGCEALAEALKVNKTLTELHLDGNQISDRGGEVLIKSLRVNKTLTELHLGWKQISDSGGELLAEALNVNETLTELHLDGNQISDRGCKALAEALKTNKTLTELYLGWNQISARGGEALAEALKVNRTLTLLHLGENKLSDRGCDALAEALKANRTLTQLHLGSNKISDRGGEALVEVLK